MKTKLSLLVLAMCSFFAFTSCDDDDNNYQPDQTVTKAFDTKYPDAGKVEWEIKNGYEIADFHLSGNEAEAWFDKDGNWLMTKTEINFGLLPEPVRLSLNGGEYKNWKATDFDKLERAINNTIVTTYVVEVEQGEQEVDLYYAEDGTLIKAVPDVDNDKDNFVPVVIPQAINEAISEMYPGASIRDLDQEKNGYEVDILHNNIYKDVYFTSSFEWMYTEWDIAENQVPEIVMGTLHASEYKNYTLEDIDLIEKPTGTFYVFELEQGDNEVEVTINAAGGIENVRKE